MKKFILPIFVALMATVCFTACSDDTDEMTDAELLAAVANSSFSYVDKDNAANTVALVLGGSDFTLTESGLTTKGDFAVSEAKLVLTPKTIDGTAADGTPIVLPIKKEGDILEFQIWNNAANDYTGATVELKKVQ